MLIECRAAWKSATMLLGCCELILKIKQVLQQGGQLRVLTIALRSILQDGKDTAEQSLGACNKSGHIIMQLSTLLQCFQVASQLLDLLA